MTTYFVAGGLMTSAWVNLVQLVVLVVGFLIALPLAIDGAGGWRAVVAMTGHDPTYWSFGQGGGSGWIYLAMLGPAFVVSPGLLQKIYGARDDHAVRLGAGANAVILLVFAFVPATFGIVARALHPALAADELALPTLLMQDVPVAVGSLGLAALFSAEVSSADAILFMLATSLSQDLYRGFVNPAASDARVLRVARLAALAGGALGVGLAIVSPTVIGALSIFYTLLSVSLFVPIVAGLLLRRGGVPEALAAIGAGVTVVMAAQLAPPGLVPAMMTPAMLGLIAAGLAFGLVLAARRPAAVAQETYHV